MHAITHKGGKSFLYYLCNQGFSISFGDLNIYLAMGEIVKVEFINLNLFRICKDQCQSAEGGYLFGRTELDFLVQHGMITRLSRKDVEQMKDKRYNKPRELYRKR